MNDEHNNSSIAEILCQSLSEYFDELGDENPQNIYPMVLAQFEKPLLNWVMNKVNGNQTHAADMLGLNRGTLRKKLKQYDII